MSGGTHLYLLPVCRHNVPTHLLLLPACVSCHLDWIPWICKSHRPSLPSVMFITPKRNISKAEAVLQAAGQSRPQSEERCNLPSLPPASPTLRSPGTNTIKPVTCRGPFWPSHTATRVRRACGHRWFIPFFDCEFGTFVPFLSMTESTDIPKNLRITLIKLRYEESPSLFPVTTVSQAN